MQIRVCRSKAFDCLPHELIIAKLHKYGASTKSCAFIWSYLKGRQQRVKINGVVSDWLSLSKGVPQGSIIGPVLFNVFINDLYYTITGSKLLNYADDNTLSVSAPSKHEMIQRLQTESLKAIEWFDCNKMEANTNKFQAITLKPDRDCEADKITLNDTDITPSESVKLLGVLLDKNLNFNDQIRSVCLKTSAQLNVLQRLARNLDFASRMAIFKTFIASHFNYCSLVWHFCGKTNTQKLERIQYRALKFVYLDFTSDYSELLLRANLPTLELARTRTLLLEIYKAVNNISPPYMRDLFAPRHIPYNLRCSDKLKQPHCRTTKYGLHSFSVQGASLWNKLPDHCKKLDLQGFKSFLRTWTIT